MENTLVGIFKTELEDLLKDRKICKSCDNFSALECSEVYESEKGCPAYMFLKRMIK